MVGPLLVSIDASKKASSSTTADKVHLLASSGLSDIEEEVSPCCR